MPDSRYATVPGVDTARSAGGGATADPPVALRLDPAGPHHRSRLRPGSPAALSAGWVGDGSPTYPREVRIDVWSDILCPFCHLGRRHLELALEQFEHSDEVGVVWHSFQLDRNAEPVQEGAQIDRVAAKYGASREQMVAQHERMAQDAAAVGLDFRWEGLRGGNSYDAHRLIHLARVLGREDEVTERVMRAWYTEGEAIGDHETLVRLATEAGLDERGRA